MYGWRLRHDASDTDTDISGSGNMTDLHYFFPLSWWVQVWTLEPKHDPTFCRIHFPQQQQVAFVSEQGMFCRKMRTVWICPVSNLKLPEEKLLRNFTKKVLSLKWRPSPQTCTSGCQGWCAASARSCPAWWCAPCGWHCQSGLGAPASGSWHGLQMDAIWSGHWMLTCNWKPWLFIGAEMGLNWSFELGCKGEAAN